MLKNLFEKGDRLKDLEKTVVNFFIGNAYSIGFILLLL